MLWHQNTSPNCAPQFFFFFFWYSAVHSRSMTPITWQVAVDVEEQQPLLQEIFEAAVDGHHV